MLKMHAWIDFLEFQYSKNFASTIRKVSLYLYNVLYSFQSGLILHVLSQFLASGGVGGYCARCSSFILIADIFSATLNIREPLDSLN